MKLTGSFPVLGVDSDDEGMPGLESGSEEEGGRSTPEDGRSTPASVLPADISTLADVVAAELYFNHRVPSADTGGVAGGQRREREVEHEVGDGKGGGIDMSPPARLNLADPRVFTVDEVREGNRGKVYQLTGPAGP